MRFMKYFAFLIFLPSFALAQYPQALNDTTTPIYFMTTLSGAEVTGKTVACKRTKNGTPNGTCAGTSTELDTTNDPGEWKYVPGAGDVDTYGTVSFRFSGTGFDTTRAVMQVGGVTIEDGTITAAKFAADGTASAVGANFITIPTVYSTNSLAYRDEVCIVSATTGAGECACAIANDGTGKITVDGNWTNALTGTVKYAVKGNRSCTMLDPNQTLAKVTAALNVPSAVIVDNTSVAAIAAAVGAASNPWTAVANAANTASGTMGEAICKSVNRSK